MSLISKRFTFSGGLGVASACSVCLASLPATAQNTPDPFEDYESWTSDEPPALPPEKPASASSVQKKPAAITTSPQLPLKSGLWSVGGSASFAYTKSKNDLVSGGSETNSTTFLRLSPTVSTFVLDRLEVGGSIGLLRKSLAREGDDKATESDWLIEATGHYFLPLSERFAFVPGLGLGGYFGSSKRTVQSGGKDVDESTGTKGFAASLYVSGAYQLSPSWQIRAGLALTGLTGSESVESEDTSLSSSTIHFGVPVELHYSFH